MSKNMDLLAQKIASDLDALSSGMAGDSHWPCSFKFFSDLYYKDISNNLEKSFSNLKKKELKEIAQSIKYPSSISQYFLFSIGLRKTTPSAKRRKMFNNMFHIISLLREDALCSNGENKLLGYQPPTFNRAISLDCGLLNFILQNYLEFNYIFFMPLAREFHGPYKINGGYLFVKEFYGLNLNHSKKNEPRKIVIYEIYRKKIKLDFFNHVLDNFDTPLISFLEVDNSWADQQRLDSLTSMFMERLNNLSGLDENTVLKNALLNFLDSFNEILIRNNYVLSIPNLNNEVAVCSNKNNPCPIKRSRSELYSLLKESFDS